MLTKKELRRLAKEARVLAMECVEGTAPQINTGSVWRHWESGRPPNCAVGHLLHRGGIRIDDGGYCSLPEDARAVLVTANENSSDLDRHGAIVFPLLALADALEDASKASPRP